MARSALSSPIPKSPVVRFTGHGSGFPSALAQRLWPLPGALLNSPPSARSSACRPNRYPLRQIPCKLSHRAASALRTVRSFDRSRRHQMDEKRLREILCFVVATMLAPADE